MLNTVVSKKIPGAIIIEGHVQGLSNVRSLGEAGIPVYVVDKTTCIARYSKYCEKFYLSPDFLNDSFPEFLIKIASDNGLKNWLLLPSNDHAVYSISKHRDELLEYYKIITPDLNIIDNIYDKAKLINIAERLNIPVPKTQLYSSECDAIDRNVNYPVLTKGRNGLSFYKAIGKKALIARNESELRKQLHSIKELYSIEAVFTQELIPFNGLNHTISFTAFCIRGEIKAHWSGEKVREHPFQFGTATFARNTKEEEFLIYSKKIVKALEYTGVCEIEFIKDPKSNKYKLIEINARTWLWVGLAKACGVNYALYIYNYFHGEQKYQEPVADEVKWINPYTDLFFSIKAILSGKLKVKTYLRCLKGKKVNAIYSRNDKKPAIMYFMFLFKFLRNR